MLPGLIAGQYTGRKTRGSIWKPWPAPSAPTSLPVATGFDPEKRLLLRAGGEPLGYDVLVLDAGAAPALIRPTGPPGNAACEKSWSLSGRKAAPRLSPTACGALSAGLATGLRHAIGTRKGLVFAGGWVRRWKDAIDRRFIARYRVESSVSDPVTE